MGEKELQVLAAEGQKRLMERLNSREADVRHNSGEGQSGEGQSVPEKSLNELMREEAERDDE